MLRIANTGLKKTLQLLVEPQDWMKKDEQSFFL
jgi:hypothetical protein